MNAIVHAAHSPWRSYLQEAKCEALRMLREPAFCLPVIGFPVLFYLLFGVLLDKGEGKAAQYLLATYGAFGVIGAGLFGFGVTIAVDREKGLLRLKRALPVPPGALLLAKMVILGQLRCSASPLLWKLVPPLQKWLLVQKIMKKVQFLM